MIMTITCGLQALPTCRAASPASMPVLSQRARRPPTARYNNENLSNDIIYNPTDLIVLSSQEIYCTTKASFLGDYGISYFAPGPSHNTPSFTSTGSILSTGITTYVSSTSSNLVLYANSIAPSTSGAEGVLYIGGNLPCYNHNTKILCLNALLQEEFKPIQDLKKGDFVKTYLHGFRKIDNIGKGKFVNNPSKWDKCMYKMEKNSMNGLLEDLIVTGGHAILENGVSNLEKKRLSDIGMSHYNDKIEDKFLVLSSVSEKFVAVQDKEIYTFYHFKTFQRNLICFIYNMSRDSHCYLSS
jgi:hypothetical protein